MSRPEKERLNDVRSNLATRESMYINRVDFVEEAFEKVRKGRGWEKATRAYVAHTILKETFEDKMGVWRLMPRRSKRYAIVVSEVSLKEYLNRKKVNPCRMGEALGGMEAVRSKEVDFSVLKAGIVVGFSVHVVPVVRYQEHERDAFNESEFSTRQEAYTEWVKDQFTEMGIGIIGGCNLDYFTEETMARRNHGKRREFVRFSRPVAEISGEAQVQDPKAFEAGFVKGMGRHRSFGYGMVSLSVGT